MIIYKQHYDESLKKLERLIIQSEQLNVKIDRLCAAIDVYENKEFDIERPSYIEAIKFRMDQEGLKQKDLTDLFGSKSRVSEVLNGKRGLSKSMIIKVHKRFGIDYDVLMQESFLSQKGDQ